MEHKLTAEEILKVFSMYYGQKVLKFAKNAPATQILDYFFLGKAAQNLEGKYLSLIPISKISDEDAIEVAKMCSLDSPFIDLSTSAGIFLKQGMYEVYISYKTGYIAKRKNKQLYNTNTSLCYQFLISRSYAVPLFFSPDHTCNGMTAIELGIAVEKQ